jgi:hypothetical protein
MKRSAVAFTLLVLLCGTSGSAFPDARQASSHFTLQVQVFDWTTRRPVRRYDRVSPKHTYYVQVDFYPYEAGAGQYVLTTGNRSAGVSIVQSETFVSDDGSYDGPFFTVTPDADWKVSASLNGEMRDQFANDTFEFRTKGT